MGIPIISLREKARVGEIGWYLKVLRGLGLGAFRIRLWGYQVSVKVQGVGLALSIILNSRVTWASKFGFGLQASSWLALSARSFGGLRIAGGDKLVLASASCLWVL